MKRIVFTCCFLLFTSSILPSRYYRKILRTPTPIKKIAPRKYRYIELESSTLFEASDAKKESTQGQRRH